MVGVSFLYVSLSFCLSSPPSVSVCLSAFLEDLITSFVMAKSRRIFFCRYLHLTCVPPVALPSACFPSRLPVLVMELSSGRHGPAPPGRFDNVQREIYPGSELCVGSDHTRHVGAHAKSSSREGGGIKCIQFQEEEEYTQCTLGTHTLHHRPSALGTDAVVNGNNQKLKMEKIGSLRYYVFLCFRGTWQ